ncbi:MAG TPA: aminotransferase class I/II-fold pyridoxal phosphate-dependent enzyme, partial [Anaeromyxobacteraceae bacterium]|nr:aminotransferase class I/II-fold pyridoxal phosphate-dependent enzyme [Anaeromyxobacteraceae bacterium]
FAAVLASGESIAVEVGPGIDFMDSLVAATEKAERRPRGIVVNFPANPSAAVASSELLQKVVRFAEARDLFVVSDLAYGDLFLGEEAPPSMLSVPGARERTIEFVSLTVSYNMVGYRIGFAAGNHALVSALTRVKSYLGGRSFGASQVAAKVALTECDDFPAVLREKYRRRRDVFVQHFAAAGWHFAPPAATMFAWAAIPDPLRHLGSIEFTRRLIEGAGVFVSPGVLFGSSGEGHVRLSLSVEEDRIRLAGERIAAFLARVAAEPRPSHAPAQRGGERS